MVAQVKGIIDAFHGQRMFLYALHTEIITFSTQGQYQVIVFNNTGIGFNSVLFGIYFF